MLGRDLNMACSTNASAPEEHAADDVLKGNPMQPLFAEQGGIPSSPVFVSEASRMV